MDSDWENSDLSFPLITRELSRIRQLGMSANLGEVSYNLLDDTEIVGTPTPLLQQLLLRNINHHVRLYRDDEEQLRAIASTLSSRASSPQLTGQVLENCSFDWAQIMSSSTLRHLDITFGRGLQPVFERERRDGKVGFNAFRGVIECLPLLESLCIRDCFSHYRNSIEGNVMPNRMVVLAHLRHLLPEDRAFACAAILSHLTLPVQHSRFTLRQALAVLKRHTRRRWQFISLIEKVRGMGEAHSVDMALSSLRVSYVTGPDQQASGKLCIYHSDLYESCRSQLCPKLSSTIAAMTVRDVSVSGFCLLHMDIWGALIGRMPNATNLQVNSPWYDALEALGQPSITAYPPSTDPNRPEDEPATGYLFPRLRVLTLVEPDFYISPEYKHCVPGFADVLAKCLLVRREQHMQIQELRRHDHQDAREEDVEILRQAAPVVKWDPEPVA